MGNQIILVSGDDWEGIYVNGLLIDEEETISRSKLIKLTKEYDTLNVEIELLNYEGSKWLQERSSFPEYYHNIPNEFIERI